VEGQNQVLWTQALDGCWVVTFRPGLLYPRWKQPPVPIV